jgi:hypothetical protein
VIIAQRRGTVRRFVREPGDLCDLIILGADRVVIVRIRRTRRLHCTLQEIGQQFRESVSGLRGIASAGMMTKELWVCSYNGSWRFFRVTDDTLAELGCDGSPIVSPVQV